MAMFNSYFDITRGCHSKIEKKNDWRTRWDLVISAKSEKIMGPLRVGDSLSLRRWKRVI